MTASTKRKATFHLTQVERMEIAHAISVLLDRLVYMPERRKLVGDENDIKILQHLSNVFKYRANRDRDRP